MRQMSRYIDDAIENGIIRSDSDLARKLQISRSAVHHWRSGDKAPSEDQAAALADLLEKPEIMAQAAAKRAKTGKGREMWERVAMVLNKATAFSIVAAVGTLAAPLPAEALQRHENAPQTRIVTAERNTNYGLFRAGRSAQPASD